MGQCESSQKSYMTNSGNNDNVESSQPPLHEGSVRNLLYTEKQSSLISCSDDQTIKRFHLEDLIGGKVHTVTQYGGHSKGVNRVSLMCNYIGLLLVVNRLIIK